MCRSAEPQQIAKQTFYKSLYVALPATSRRPCVFFQLFLYFNNNVKNKKKCLNSLLNNYHLVTDIKLGNSNFEKVNNNLTQIFGIGKWTAEMFSIFYLGLPNIMPLGDLGFINAYKKYYKDKNLSKFSFHSNKWRNYSTIVTWYLWSSYDSEPLYL